MDLEELNRAVYTFFDVLGNVGGLGGVLFSIAAFINGIFSFNRSENYLVSHLFKQSASTDLP